jgi:hypothetical protein
LGAPGCAHFGRGYRCILEENEVTDCDPTRADACQSTCATLHERLTEDAQKSYDASLRYQACRKVCPNEPGANDVCEFIVRVNGQCYRSTSGAGLGTAAYDCALSDQEILAMPANLSDTSAGGGTSVPTVPYCPSGGSGATPNDGGSTLLAGSGGQGG